LEGTLRTMQKIRNAGDRIKLRFHPLAKSLLIVPASLVREDVILLAIHNFPVPMSREFALQMAVFCGSYEGQRRPIPVIHAKFPVNRPLSGNWLSETVLLRTGSRAINLLKLQVFLVSCGTRNCPPLSGVCRNTYWRKRR
jgi:hypothetical protein